MFLGMGLPGGFFPPNALHLSSMNAVDVSLSNPLIPEGRISLHPLCRDIDLLYLTSPHLAETQETLHDCGDRPSLHDFSSRASGTSYAHASPTPTIHGILSMSVLRRDNIGDFGIHQSRSLFLWDGLALPR